MAKRYADKRPGWLRKLVRISKVAAAAEAPSAKSAPAIKGGRPKGDSVVPIGPLRRGPKTNPNSERQTKPWEELLISQRTYYRYKQETKL